MELFHTPNILPQIRFLFKIAIFESAEIKDYLVLYSTYFSWWIVILYLSEIAF